MKGQSPLSILFTNLYLGSYTGSELHILRLATEFVKHGWHVCCYTLISSFPLLPVFESRGIKIVEFGNESELEEHYDVLYAQHFVVSDYLTSNFHTAFRYVVVSSLGTATDQEHLPSFASSADLVVFVSGECRDARYHELGETFAGSILLFTNYADQEYFAAASQDTYSGLPADHPLKIAVISNHVAPEVSELESAAPDNVQIDFIGLSAASKEVTPHLLSAYDLVITIGRTIQCCMAQMIPVYCYDRFGGPGYLNPDELDVHLYANYSGRSCPTKRSAAELWDDICQGYAQSVRNLEDLRAYATDHFKFEGLFGKLLNSVEQGLHVRNEYTQAQDGRMAVPYRMMANLMRDKLVREYGTAEFRKLNLAGDYDCVRFRYKYKTWVDYKLPESADTAFQRFDPASVPCVVHHTCDHITATNALTSTVDSNEHTDVFVHVDPIYSVQEGLTRIHMLVEPKSIGKISLEAWQDRNSDLQALRELKAQSQDLVSQISRLVQEQTVARKEQERSACELAIRAKQLKKLEHEAAINKAKLRELRTTVDTLSKRQKSLRWTVGNLWRLLKERIKQR